MISSEEKDRFPALQYGLRYRYTCSSCLPASSSVWQWRTGFTVSELLLQPYGLVHMACSVSQLILKQWTIKPLVRLFGQAFA